MGHFLPVTCMPDNDQLPSEREPNSYHTLGSWRGIALPIDHSRGNNLLGSLESLLD